MQLVVRLLLTVDGSDVWQVKHSNAELLDIINSGDNFILFFFSWNFQTEKKFKLIIRFWPICPAPRFYKNREWRTEPELAAVYYVSFVFLFDNVIFYEVLQFQLNPVR